MKYAFDINLFSSAKCTNVLRFCCHYIFLLNISVIWHHSLGWLVLRETLGGHLCFCYSEYVIFVLTSMTLTKKLKVIDKVHWSLVWLLPGLALLQSGLSLLNQIHHKGCSNHCTHVRITILTSALCDVLPSLSISYQHGGKTTQHHWNPETSTAGEYFIQSWRLILICTTLESNAAEGCQYDFKQTPGNLEHAKYSNQSFQISPQTQQNIC